jgi:predicted nucleic acid-binding protein
MHKVFVDSDVVISSLISSTGAAHLLLHRKDIVPFISSYSKKELLMVIKRLSIEKERLQALIERFKIVKLVETIAKIKEGYREYTSDVCDAHIIAGAVKAKTGFVISYNIRHFQVDKIKRDFDIKVTTPANFLQYLRSQ